MSRNQSGTNQPQPNVVQADVHGRETEEDEIIEFNDSTRGDITNEMDETRATEPNKTPSPTVLRLKEQQLLEREDALLKKEREYYRKLAAMEKLQKSTERLRISPINPYHDEDYNEEDEEEADESNQDTMESLNTELKELESTWEAQPEQPLLTGVDILTPQAQQIQALEKEIEAKEAWITDVKEDIATLLELARTNPGTHIQKRVDSKKRNLIKVMQEQHKLKAKLERSKTTKDKFRSIIPMPEYNRPPRDFKRDRLTMDRKNIRKTIDLIFDPIAFPGREFLHVWEQVLSYGSYHYLNEKEHIQVLAEVLNGEPLLYFKDWKKQGKSLEQILKGLTTIYGATITIDDYIKQLNDFKREPLEPIRRTMMRYERILAKTLEGPMNSYWNHEKDTKMIIAIKMFVTQTTRKHLEAEERLVRREGGIITVDYLLDLAEEYETRKDAMPKNEMKSTFLTATLAPAHNSESINQTENQLKAMQTHHMGNKEVMKTIQGLRDQLTQIASALPEKRSRPNEQNGQPQQIPLDLAQIENRIIKAAKRKFQDQKGYQPNPNKPQNQTGGSKPPQQNPNKPNNPPKPQNTTNQGTNKYNNNNKGTQGYKPNNYGNGKPYNNYGNGNQYNNKGYLKAFRINGTIYVQDQKRKGFYKANTNNYYQTNAVAEEQDQQEQSEAEGYVLDLDDISDTEENSDYEEEPQETEQSEN